MRGFGIDVAGQHHHRVVGRIEATVEADGVVAGELLHLVAPADYRLAVRVVEEQRRIDLLAETGARIVGDALVLFLENNVTLGQHHRVGELQACHAVGLEVHHRFELLARHALVIAGVVLRGEGVLLTAHAGDDLREHAGGMFGRALEHQMFEEMRQPGFARRLVGGADLVPDHMGDDRRSVVGNDHQLEPVRQGELRDFRAARLRRERGVRGQCRSHNDDNANSGTDFAGHVRGLKACRRLLSGL